MLLGLAAIGAIAVWFLPAKPRTRPEQVAV
jgi:hypothetical protein